MARIAKYLNGTEINTSIYNGDAKVRRVSIDLKVDCIIKRGNVIRKDIIKILPQEMFIVVLKGKVEIPNNCFGIAYPKTGLCQQGIHVLNTGLFDPGYNGYVSTVAINFSSTTVEIRKDDVYLRLTIYENQNNYNAVTGETPVSITYDDYIQKRIEDSEIYPETFLDVPKQVENLSNKMASLISTNITNKVLYILTAFTIVLSVSTYLIGNTKLDRMQDVFLNKSSELVEVKSNQEIVDLNKKYNELLEKVKEIEAKKAK